MGYGTLMEVGNVEAILIGGNANPIMLVCIGDAQILTFYDPDSTFLYLQTNLVFQDVLLL